mgnify:CR=1 FL=1
MTRLHPSLHPAPCWPRTGAPSPPPTPASRGGGRDPKTAQKVDFYARPFVDAMSPSNVLLTNPEVLRKTAETGGENLLRGLSNLLSDLERGRGKLTIKMTDLDAFTLGENIADNSGLAIAYKAYHLSLHGKPAPTIDGMSGDARFYRGFAAEWRSKVREPAEIVRIKTDPHSPGEFRANGTLRNQAPFYSAYNVQPGDGMYLAPDKRVTIW